MSEQNHGIVANERPPRPTAPSQTEDGVVGFFDILGYQSFLDNNRDHGAIEKVIDNLLALESEMPRIARDYMVDKCPNQETAKYIESIVNSIHWLVFSDTIVLTLSLKKSDLAETYYDIFLVQCAFLWRNMFNFGLPLRGAITKGSFLVRDTCFAGRAIVEAYKLANDINLAGVVISDKAHDWRNTNGRPAKQHHFCYDYLIPSKSKGFFKSSILNVSVWPHGTHTWDDDIRQLVHSSFWCHNKDLGPGVSEKLDNTEKLLRFLKFQYPGGFLPTQESMERQELFERTLEEFRSS